MTTKDIKTLTLSQLYRYSVYHDLYPLTTRNFLDLYLILVLLFMLQ